MKITILGDCPSKKNSRIISFRGSRPMSFPSAHYRDWHRDAQKQLMQYRRHKMAQTQNLHMNLTFFPKTARKSDLTNKAESIMDALVDGGILLDDNWYRVPKLKLNFGAVDKLNPRVEIEII